MGDSWIYHSVVSVGMLNTDNEGAFLGCGVEEVILGEKLAVVTRVEGKAWYTSTESFLAERGDNLGWRGFVL